MSSVVELATKNGKPRHRGKVKVPHVTLAHGGGGKAMHELIEGIGHVPHQRTTLYRAAPAERVAASFRAPPLVAVVTRPPRRDQRSRDRALVRFG